MSCGWWRSRAGREARSVTGESSGTWRGFTRNGVEEMAESLVETLVGVVLMSVVALAPNAVLGLLIGCVLLPFYLMQRDAKKRASRPVVKKQEPDPMGGTGDGPEATRTYAAWAPTRARLLEWRKRLVVTPLGGEREAQFKALLDRVLSEDFFNRFGDSFIVVMKVTCFQLVRPADTAPQELWNAVLKRHMDFLICDRWTLEPVLAILVWLGKGEPPETAGGSEASVSAVVSRKLTGQEWEQWIAQGMMLAVGIPAMVVTRQWVDACLARPELLLQGIEPALAGHREDALVREQAAA